MPRKTAAQTAPEPQPYTAEDYEAYLEGELRSLAYSIREGIRQIKATVNGIEVVMERPFDQRMLNDLGEIQGRASMLDAKIAAYARIRYALMEYRKVER